MARLLQALILATALAAAQPHSPSKPFSHRQHLALKLQCLSCHATVGASTRVQDNNLPDPALCAQCHAAGSVQIKAPRKLRVDHFSHKDHLKRGAFNHHMGMAIEAGQYLSTPPANWREASQSKNPCIACHRGIETSDQVSASHFPQMADCLICHTDVDPPFSCTKCHVESPGLKPASHSAGFLDRHSNKDAKLDKATCAVCHGRKFTCLGCH